jgi:hypothetical protein
MTTPIRAVLPPEQNQSLKNTPWSTSSASYESYQAQNTQEHYLAADIASTIPFKDFLHFVFDFAFDSPTDANWREIHAIAISRCCQALLDKYKDEVGHETERCDKFNNLANYIITELDKRCPSQAKSIVLCRNDHVPVEDSSATRIPDCVIVPESATDHSERTSWDSLSKDGPTINSFHWCELLAFVEIKLEKWLLHSPLSASSTEAATATTCQSSSTPSVPSPSV